MTPPTTARPSKAKRLNALYADFAKVRQPALAKREAARDLADEIVRKAQATYDRFITPYWSKYLADRRAIEAEPDEEPPK